MGGKQHRIPAKEKYKLWYYERFHFDGPDIETNPTGRIDHIPAHKADKLAFVTQREKEVLKSVREHGIRNPVLVVVCSNGPMQLHPGQTRCRALRKLGRTTVPALVVDFTGKFNLGVELTPVMAEALFIDDMKLTIDEDGFYLRAIREVFDGEKPYPAREVSYANP